MCLCDKQYCIFYSLRLNTTSFQKKMLILHLDTVFLLHLKCPLSQWSNEEVAHEAKCKPRHQDHRFSLLLLTRTEGVSFLSPFTGLFVHHLLSFQTHLQGYKVRQKSSFCRLTSVSWVVVLRKGDDLSLFLR